MRDIAKPPAAGDRASLDDLAAGALRDHFARRPLYADEAAVPLPFSASENRPFEIAHVVLSDLWSIEVIQKGNIFAFKKVDGGLERGFCIVDR